jgi:Short C-terminal domain
MLRCSPLMPQAALSGGAGEFGKPSLTVWHINRRLPTDDQSGPDGHQVDFAYMISQATGMAERSGQQAQHAREELRRAVGFSVTDEIEKLDRLKKSGSITDQEFTRLRAKLVQ